MSTAFEVARFKIVDVDGRHIAVPTEVVLHESGADKISRRQTETLVVDETSLKVNKDVHVDDGLFTLDTKGVKVIDVDDFNRKVATAEGRDKRGRIGGSSNSLLSGRVMVLCANAIVIAGLVTLYIVRRRGRGSRR